MAHGQLREQGSPVCGTAPRGWAGERGEWVGGGSVRRWGVALYEAGRDAVVTGARLTGRRAVLTRPCQH